MNQSDDLTAQSDKQSADSGPKGLFGALLNAIQGHDAKEMAVSLQLLANEQNGPLITDDEVNIHLNENGGDAEKQPDLTLFKLADYSGRANHVVPGELTFTQLQEMTDDVNVSEGEMSETEKAIGQISISPEKSNSEHTTIQGLPDQGYKEEADKVPDGNVSEESVINEDQIASEKNSNGLKTSKVRMESEKPAGKPVHQSSSLLTDNQSSGTKQNTDTDVIGRLPGKEAEVQKKSDTNQISATVSSENPDTELGEMNSNSTEPAMNDQEKVSEKPRVNRETGLQDARVKRPQFASLRNSDNRVLKSDRHPQLAQNQTVINGGMGEIGSEKDLEMKSSLHYSPVTDGVAQPENKLSGLQALIVKNGNLERLKSERVKSISSGTQSREGRLSAGQPRTGQDISRQALGLNTGFDTISMHTADQTEESTEDPFLFWNQLSYEGSELEEDSKQSHAAQGLSRLGQIPVLNESVRRQLMNGVVQGVRKTFSGSGKSPDSWQKHRFTLENGKNIQISIRRTEGVLQLKLGSSHTELAKILQVHQNELKELLQKEFEIEVDLQFDQNDGRGQPSVFEELNHSASNHPSISGESSAASENRKQEYPSGPSIRKFGYNQMEWTV